MNITSPEALLSHLSSVGDIEPVEAYLTEGELDEPPLYTRLKHIDALHTLTADERNRTLFGAALLQADRIVSAAAAALHAYRLHTYACLITLMEWNTSEPIIPRLLISTNARAELRHLELRRPQSAEAKTTARWLVELGRQSAFIVMDSAVPPAQPELFRVYVGHSQLPNPMMVSLENLFGS